MLDKERVLTKIDEFDGYMEELKQILPVSFQEYGRIEKKRSCERLLQLCIECMIDVCKFIVSGLRLGLPGEENDVFNKVRKKGIISEGTADRLKKMRGLRNILIHEYAAIDDKIVYEILKSSLKDLSAMRQEILSGMNNQE